MKPRYLSAGESAVVVEWSRVINAEAHAAVMALDAALAAQPVAGILETVPTYRSLMVHFDPRQLTADALIEALGSVDPSDAPRARPRSWLVPACYEMPYAEDLVEAAGILGLAPERVVSLHAEARYTVVMYGFAPGFAFLGGLAPELVLSRRLTPRPPAPFGALTIGGGQTLISSFVMPTGWYVLGRTPARTFDPRRDPMFPVAVGDHVRFERVDAARFAALEADAQAGKPVFSEDS